MSGRNTFIRSLHDIGLAAWFGGGLMGATGLNGAASRAANPQERASLSSDGWAIWTPWQVAAVGVHAIGGAGLIISNRNRLNAQPGATANTVAKLAVTVAAAGVTAYSGFLGTKVKKNAGQGASGATDPSATSSPELASAQKQLKVLQWAIPGLTGVLLVLGAQQGEQQRGVAGALDFSHDDAEVGTKAVKKRLLRSS